MWPCWSVVAKDRSSCRCVLIELTLYGRVGCHLCEDMVAGLKAFQPEYGFTLTEVDVDQSLDLVQRYGSRVPVLTLGGEEVCHYFLDVVRLKAVFAAH